MKNVRRAGISRTSKDRTVGLVVFGFLQVMLGMLGALIVVYAAFRSSQTESGSTAVDMPGLRWPLIAAALGLTMAAYRIWAGIGSILYRRWARAVILVVSWIELATGAVSFVAMLLCSGKLLTMLMAMGLPPGFRQLAMIGLFGMTIFPHVVLPCAMVLFYQSPHVKATCEAKGPRAPWTERCPAPILGVSIGTVYASYMCLALAQELGAFPLFGAMVGGSRGLLLFMLTMAILLVLAYGNYKRRLTAWLGTIGIIVVLGISISLTLFGTGLRDSQKAVIAGPAMPDALMEMTVFSQSTILPTFLAQLAMALAYVLAVTKYFLSHRRETGALHRHRAQPSAPA